MSDDILVSCLMVTLPTPQRMAFAKRAIAAYCAQTYPHRELVIVYQKTDAGDCAGLDAYIGELDRDDIVLVEAAQGMTLGALRNLSMARARGAVHCQWDDDDLHHPLRVEKQLAALVDADAEAVGLQEAMQFFPARRELYWTNWHETPATILPGTIMYRAQAPIRYPETGPTARLGEDTDVCAQLLSRNELSPIAGWPQLFIYMSHGSNSWDDGHHLMLAEQLGLSRGLLRRREAWIRDVLASVDLGAGPISVRGPNGVAFTVDG